MLDNKKISEKLVSLRKNKRLTQMELAQKINYSDKVISKWERGESLPGIEGFKILADFYNLTVDELISNDELLNDSIETAQLEISRTQGPSLFVRISIIFPIIFFILGIISAGGNGDYSIFFLSFVILMLYTVIWSILIVYVTYEATYKGHTITFINKPLSARLYIDDKLVDENNSIVTLGYKLTGKIGNKTIKVNISANASIKCNMFVE